jgi:membrane protein YdbS with pleckstrin-like domain
VITPTGNKGPTPIDRHFRLRKRVWMLPLLVVALIAGHAILYYAVSHKVLSAAVASGAIVLVVIKHLGLLGPFYALLRRRSRRLKPGDLAAGGRD